jgi:hypothetical protein
MQPRSKWQAIGGIPTLASPVEGLGVGWGSTLDRNLSTLLVAMSCQRALKPFAGPEGV